MATKQAVGGICIIGLQNTEKYSKLFNSFISESGDCL